MREISADDILEIVHQHEDKWYFWDEVWANRIGPYDTKDQTEDKLKEYAKNLGVNFI